MIYSVRANVGLIAFFIINFNALISNVVVNGQKDVTENATAFNNTNNYYWPPVYNSETIELEEILMQQLDLGCSMTDNQTSNSNTNNSGTVETNSSSISTYFMISETENREKLNNPHPQKFVHIPSGTSLEIKFECDDCPNNKISFNGRLYDTSTFECKTLCIFTARKSHTDSCRKAQMYQIGLKLKNKFYKLIEACHHLEVPSNITYDAETLIWKLGKFSRTIQNEKTICQPKCMPVCREMNNLYEMENHTMKNNENYVKSFMENICKENFNQNSKHIEEIVCNDEVNGSNTLTVKNIGFLILILNIIVIKCF